MEDVQSALEHDDVGLVRKRRITRSRAVWADNKVRCAVLAVLAIYVCIVVVAVYPNVTNRPQTAPILLLVIQGFRWDYLTLDDSSLTPNLRFLINNGLHVEHLVPVFPSKTVTNLWSLVTGLFAESHGVLSESMYDADLQSWFNVSNSSSSWWGGTPLWRTAASLGHYVCVYDWPGCDPSQDVCASNAVNNVTAIVDAIAAHVDDPMLPFVSATFRAVRDAAATYGPLSPELIQTVGQVDSVMGQFIRELQQKGLFDRINLVIASDHGLVQLEGVFYLDDYIIPLQQRADVLDWSPVLTVEPTSAANIDYILTATTNLFPYMTVYAKQDIPENYHYKRNRRVPAVVTVFDPGWAVSSRYDSHTPPGRLSIGQEGYDPVTAVTHGMLIGTGPSFRRGVELVSVELIHVYTLMSHLLAIRAPVSNNGSYGVWFDGLNWV
eukprot:GILK01013222.1.p1 GENE.GILK01013222.1~~GILK01013222.1.p1  ORF type:complete len:437 (+),score=61.60 GILK01013222.1:89-1399(+)